MQLLPNADKFLIGCNYWSSQSGISMWRDWSESAVEQDFAALKDAGMNTVRIFPLWSDFQPVSSPTTNLRSYFSARSAVLRKRSIITLLKP